MVLSHASSHVAPAAHLRGKHPVGIRVAVLPNAGFQNAELGQAPLGGVEEREPEALLAVLEARISLVHSALHAAALQGQGRGQPSDSCQPRRQKAIS